MDIGIWVSILCLTPKWSSMLLLLLLIHKLPECTKPKCLVLFSLCIQFHCSQFICITAFDILLQQGLCRALYQNGSLQSVISFAGKSLQYFWTFCSSSFNLDHILSEWKRKKIISCRVKTVAHMANDSSVSFSTSWHYFLNVDYSWKLKQGSELYRLGPFCKPKL